MKRLKGEGKAAAPSIKFKHDTRYNASGNPVAKPRSELNKVKTSDRFGAPINALSGLGSSRAVHRGAGKKYISG